MTAAVIALSSTSSAFLQAQHSSSHFLLSSKVGDLLTTHRKALEPVRVDKRAQFQSLNLDHRAALQGKVHGVKTQITHYFSRACSFVPPVMLVASALFKATLSRRSVSGAAVF